MSFEPFNPEVVVGPKVNPEDLGAGFYTQLSDRPAKLDARLRSILRWCSRYVGRMPASVELVAQSREGDITGTSDSEPALPTVMVWEKGSDKEFRQDASLVYYFPETALVDLKRAFGGDASVLVWFKDDATVPPNPSLPLSPVGERWPEKDEMVGGEAYRPRITPDVNPVGSLFLGPSGTPNVLYKKVIRSVGFVQFPVWVKQTS